jgi:peptide deformylase
VPFDLEAWLVAAPPAPPVVQAGAEVLRRRAHDVPASLIGTPALARLVEVMVQVMRAAPGVGLAAPQIGVPLRLFVAEDNAERMAHQTPESHTLRSRVALPLMAVVNPEVVALTADEVTFYEGCLSVRGYGALVRRAASVEVTGVDPEGRPLSVRFDGWPARIMQHETDHLDGTLYVDRMITRSLACDSELARLAALPPSEVLDELGRTA